MLDITSDDSNTTDWQVVIVSKVDGVGSTQSRATLRRGLFVRGLSVSDLLIQQLSRMHVLVIVLLVVRARRIPSQSAMRIAAVERASITHATIPVIRILPEPLRRG